VAVGGFLGKIGGRSSGGSRRVGVISKTDLRARVGLMDEFEDAGLGMFWATDCDGNLIYLSDSAASIIGRPVQQVLGNPLGSLFSLEDKDDDDTPQRPLSFLLSARSKISELPVRIAVKGSERDIWWSITGRPLMEEGEFLGYRGNAKDITAQRQKERDNAKLAEYDSLTGLANRHRMGRRLNKILVAYKAAKRNCALMMLDLDRFKQVNDTLGHPAGDELLKQVSQRLGRIVGNQGEIGRLGGDEFQVILPDIDDRGRLGDIAARIIQMLSQPYSIDGARCIIGASVGIAIAPFDGLESDELVRSADLALYAAKGGGRGQYRFYSTDLKDSAEERRQIEEDLRDALSRGELAMHYQPIVRVQDNTVAGCEALMRWQHPERGYISPGTFIPVAEDSNLINVLGEWALRQACEDAAAWPSNMQVSVNVSAVQLATSGFATVVANVLAATGIEPDRLELEITESVFMGDADANESIFKALKGLGVRLSLDDFGTGYSSLGYLRDAPFDKIKVDQSFVRTSTEKGDNSAAIVAAIISLAKALGMDTTVEGVEAFDQLDMVRKEGGALIQGFLFSRAMTQEALLEKIGDGELVIQPDGPQKHRPERKTVFRRINVIHEDHCYDAVMRDISKTGAKIEGLLGVPKGTPLVLDLGNGQLAVSRVMRSEGAMQGVEFESPLVSDGAGGLCTRHRVSPYALAAAGMPLRALPPGQYPLAPKNDNPSSKPAFMQVMVQGSPH
jgi:diguanylate cyclase (GGDEF)-like protein/PAS domain S-box-containing protein